MYFLLLLLHVERGILRAKMRPYVASVEVSFGVYFTTVIPVLPGIELIQEIITDKRMNWM